MVTVDCDSFNFNDQLLFGTPMEVVPCSCRVWIPVVIKINSSKKKKKFNIYLNDLLFQLADTHVCNFADDTTLNACDIELQNVMHELEDNTLTAIMWFENNYMKLNQSKCHFFDLWLL